MSKHFTIRPILAVYSLLLLGAATALANPPATAPATQAGEHVWHITDYLKGTSSQIHELLCHEVHRLNGLIDPLEKTIADEKEAIEAQRKPIIAAQLDREDYRRAVADAAACKEKLDKDRANHDTAAALVSGGVYNKARDVVASQERAAGKVADADPAIARDLKRLAADQASLKPLLAARVKALQWHDDLVDAIRNSALLDWPLGKGSSGTLGEIVPTVIENDGKISCVIKLMEKRTARNSGEGISSVGVKFHPVRIMIENANADKFAVNHPVRFDHNVEVIDGARATGGEIEAVITVRIKHDDLDDLLDAISQP